MAGTAYASMQTYLGYRESSTGAFKVACFIKDVPDLGGEPETIDVSTLANKDMQTNILGLQSSSNYQFVYNYGEEVEDGVNPYSTIKALDGKTCEWALLLPNGDAFVWKGEADTYVNGFGVNAVIEATLIVSKASEPELKKGVYAEETHQITIS